MLIGRLTLTASRATPKSRSLRMRIRSTYASRSPFCAASTRSRSTVQCARRGRVPNLLVVRALATFILRFGILGSLALARA